MTNKTFTLAYPPPIITPKGLLREFCTTGTHVCYTGILDKYEDYEDFYRGKVKSQEAVILDHSPGVSRVAPTNILKWVDRLKPRVVVLPDFNYQMERTVKDSLHMLQQLESYDISTIGVLQGTDIDELQICYTNFKDVVNVIGLPAGLEKIADRNDIVFALEIKGPCVFIEIYKSLNKERPKHPNVELMWSALPLRLAYNGELFTSVKSTVPDLDFSSEYVPEHATINIGNYIRTLSGNLPVYRDLLEAD